MWIAVVIVAVGQFAITYLHPVQAVFGTQAIGIFDGLLILLIGVALFTIIEIEKQMRLRLATPFRGSASR